MAGTIKLRPEGGHKMTRTGYGQLTFDWVGDASGGSVPTITLPPIDGNVVLLVTDPGSPAPTALYDVTLVDENGIDQLQGLGADRSATVTEEVLITYSGTIVYPFLLSFRTYTLTITGTSVNSAQGTVMIVYQLPRKAEWS